MEHDVRIGQKFDSNAIINSMLFNGGGPSSRFHIPLCRMIGLPLVRPLLQSQVKRLEADFARGYRPGDRVLYVSTTNDKGACKLVTPEIVETWDECWIQENDQFECWLKSQPTISHLSNHMFFVWDGNLRLAAWYAYIHKMHRYDRKWHFQVDCMLLVSEGRTCMLLEAMNDINWLVSKSGPHYFSLFTKIYIFFCCYVLIFLFIHLIILNLLSMVLWVY